MKYLNLLTSNKSINLSSKNNYYLIAFILLLILIRIFSTYNFTFSNLLNIFLVFTILFALFKNIKKAIIYTIIFAILYMITIYFILKNNFENFENSEDEEKPKSDKKDDNKEELRAQLDSLIKKFESQHNSGKSNIDTSKLEKYTEHLKGKIELKDDDTTENEPVGIDTSKMVHDEIKPDPLKKAQKETYELIDTISILKETVQSLNPVLSEGKKVMDLFKGLNMDGLDEGTSGSLSALLGGSDKEKK